MRRASIVVLAALLGGSAAQAAGLREVQVRGFVAAQERAWNSGDLAAYFSAFTPDAIFRDQYRTPGGAVVPYGESTLPQARAQSVKHRAGNKVSEAGQILRITANADGSAAQVASRIVSRTQAKGGLRVSCAERLQTLVLIGGRVRSKGQIDTFSRCPR